MLQTTEVVKSIQLAIALFNKTLDGKCTVIVRSLKKNPKTKVNELKELEAYKNIPCRLSFNSAGIDNNGDTTSSLSNVILLVNKEVNIPANSKIEVEYKGKSYLLTNGKVKIYSTHASYVCKEFIKWL